MIAEILKPYLAQLVGVVLLVLIAGGYLTYACASQSIHSPEPERRRDAALPSDAEYARLRLPISPSSVGK